MVALFYFSHLFELFRKSDDNVGDEKILIGEFLRAKDKLLSLPGVVMKPPRKKQIVQVEAEAEIEMEIDVEMDVNVEDGGKGGDTDTDKDTSFNNGLTLDLWREEFFKMDSEVGQNDNICFHEFCQYAVRELIAPEPYLESYQKKAYDPHRPSYPPRFDRRISYIESLARCNKRAKVKDKTKTRTMIMKKQITESETEQPDNSRSREEEIINTEQENGRETALHQQENSTYSNTISILFTSRGRIRPASAPPPPSPLSLPRPCAYALLRPTVFNGRNIVSNKKAQKKKYNTFHQYKLDPNNVDNKDSHSNSTSNSNRNNSNSKKNYTSSKKYPKKSPPVTPNRGSPKQLLVSTSYPSSVVKIGKNTTGPVPNIIPNKNYKNNNNNNDDEYNRHNDNNDDDNIRNSVLLNNFSSSFSTLAEEQSRTLRLLVPLQSQLDISEEEMKGGVGETSMCLTAEDSVTICDLSMPHH